MISVVMPVYVTNEELYQLTRSALISLGNGYELIMVDNGSPLGADQFLSVSTIYIRNQENLGYPKAVNQGVKLASGDLIAVANNDIRVSPNWKEVTEEAFERIKNLGSLHFRMVGYEEDFGLDTKLWQTGKERWCTGSFFVWSREAVKKLDKEYGYVLDEEYGLGGYDDWDWHHRLNHLLKYKSAYTNGAAYQHNDSATRKSLNKDWDPKNREHFKDMWSSYPEDIWEELYPEQMKVPYRPFP